MRVLEPGEQLDFTLESVGVDPCRELRMQQLDHDRARQRNVFGQKHARHSTTAQLAFDAKGGAEGGRQLVDKVRHGLRRREVWRKMPGGRERRHSHAA
jgi:hypothetical protein